MRIRYLKPSFFLNEILAELPFETRLVYTGLWCCADKLGRLEDRPRKLKAEIVPYDDTDIEKQLSLLAGKKFIIRYEVEGIKYIQVEKWDKHQKVHHTEKDSEIPPIPPLNGESKGKGKGKEGKGKRETPNGEKHVKQPLFELFNEIESKFDKEELLLKKEFLSYWTEKSKGGLKERWEMEKVFDVAKRFKNKAGKRG